MVFNYMIARINIFKFIPSLKIPYSCVPFHTDICSVYKVISKNVCIHFLYVVSPNLASTTVLPPWTVLPKVSPIPAVQSEGRFAVIVWLLCSIWHPWLSFLFESVSCLFVRCSVFLGFTPASQGAASWTPELGPLSLFLLLVSLGFCLALFISHYSLSHPSYPFPLLPLTLVTFTSSPDHFTEVQIHLYKSLLFISILIPHRYPKSIILSCPQIFSLCIPHLNEWHPHSLRWPSQNVMG